MEENFWNFVTPDTFDEDYYLKSYLDVKEAVKNGTFKSGYEHYMQCGYQEGRSFVCGFHDIYYQQYNSDVKRAINFGYFKCGLDHYLKFGNKEERIIDASDISVNKYKQLIHSSFKKHRIPLKLYIMR